MTEHTTLPLQDQLLPYLPEVMRDDPATRDFLRAFATLLLGHDSCAGPSGLEQIIADLPRYFTAGKDAEGGAPDDFLPWLSQWVALSLRTDIYSKTEEDQDQSELDKKNNKVLRTFVANMVKIYSVRGTEQGLLRLLKIFTGTDATINHQIDGQPHFFKVWLNLEKLKTSNSQQAYDRAMELAHSVIQKEKPAHTRYRLIPEIVTMRIGPGTDSQGNLYFIKIGENTRIGVTPNPIP